jgi:CBS-domain-containing membrane protein
MQAKDVMTEPVITISSQSSVLEAVQLMLQNKISGLPVLDDTGSLVGVITEGDFLRRTETNTLRRRPRWIEFFVGPGKLAEEYVHANGRQVDEVMSTQVLSVSENTPLDEVVSIMEHHLIKRVPVVHENKIVGIVTRANLLRALMDATRSIPSRSTNDAAIRSQLLDHLDQQKWAPVGAIGVAVSNGTVTLSGVITDERQRQALCVAAENISGVKKVEDQLAWLVPGTGVMGEPVMIVGPGQG